MPNLWSMTVYRGITTAVNNIQPQTKIQHHSNFEVFLMISTKV